MGTVESVRKHHDNNNEEKFKPFPRNLFQRNIFWFKDTVLSYKSAIHSLKENKTHAGDGVTIRFHKQHFPHIFLSGTKGVK